MRIGCYRTKSGGYFFSHLSDDDVMDKHTNRPYCVILEVDDFKVFTRGEPVDHEMDKFYPKNRVELTNRKLVRKYFKKQGWVSYE